MLDKIKCSKCGNTDQEKFVAQTRIVGLERKYNGMGYDVREKMAFVGWKCSCCNELYREAQNG